MKSVFLKAAALLLAICLVVPLAACSNGEDGKETQEESGAATEAGTESFFPDIKEADYGEEFTALACTDTFRQGYFFIAQEDVQPGNDLEEKVYERAKKVEDYLGVDVIYVDGGNYVEYGPKIKAVVQANDNSYQMVMTHVYMEVATFITGNMLLDFNELDSLNLDQPYWNQTMMTELAVNDKMYCGYNDFCLSLCYLIGFNKDIVAKYQPAMGNLYDMVRNREWTLDKMIELSSLVSEDSNGDGKFDKDDTYGFAGLAWVPMISFMTASDIKLVDRDENDELYIAAMADHADKMTTLTEKLLSFYKADCTSMWPHDDSGDHVIHLNSNRLLFEMLANYDLIHYKEESVKVGALPYPLYDTKQASYKTLNWNGQLCVPSTNSGAGSWVSDTIEMIAFFTEPVRYSFYETLLGAKVADAPDDVEMLNIIWNSQVSDLGLVFSSTSTNMDQLLYSIPACVTAGNANVAAKFKSNEKSAAKNLSNMFKKAAQKDK
ncbi:MAG: hypothetical protein MJ192_09995 [Clostridia bacterium]|nr:hypothetical protein [Clostridia bacterium]